MNALVTGGAGFIGHHLVMALLARGDRVGVIDDLSTGREERLAPVADRVDLVVGSILDPDALGRAVAGREVIFHLAAVPSVARSLETPLLTDAVNVRGTIEVMEAAARQGVRRVVFAGSSSVYGPSVELPCRETSLPMPESPYGVSKLAAEHYVRTLGKHRGVETAILRYFNVFGPGQDPASEYAAVVPRFVTSTLDGRRPTVNGDGSVSRDFTYVDNVVQANLLAAAADVPSGLCCNVACGTRTSLLELLDAIGHAAGRTPDPVFGPPRPGDIVHSMADITLARSALGYEPQVAFREGIERTVAWYRGVAE